MTSENLHPDASARADRPVRRALVVEDDAAIRQLAAAVLRRERFAVDEACNGREALARLAQESAYEIVLLDVTMPEMGGIELIEHVRERVPTTLRRIIIITASLHIRHLFPEGICKVVTKPFELADLIHAVHECAVSSHNPG